MTEEELLTDFFRTSSNCWGLKFFPCYVLKGDSPVELIEEEDCWMVVLPDEYDCPPGFERLRHFSDDLEYWGKDFPSLDEAVRVYMDVHNRITGG